MPTTAIAGGRAVRRGVLPGGVMAGGERRRSFVLRAVTGKLEMRILELADEAISTPEKVTALLCEAVAEVGGKVATPEVVDRCCVADRQFLLRALLTDLGQDELWLAAVCGGCGARFDARVVLAQLPVREAVDYPETRVTTSVGRLRLRVPNGADQAAIAALGRKRALPALAARLVCGIEDETDSSLQPWAGDEFSAADLAAIEQQMDAVFPALLTQVQGACPECGRSNRLDVSPLAFLGRIAAAVVADVDVLARHYHWPEAAILRLPRARRRRYTRFLDRVRGFSD